MSQKYQISINDDNYSSFSFVNYDTNEIIPNETININPIENKLFDKDVFMCDNNNITVCNSHVRTGIPIAGVLMLENNKTFGRTKNKKRLLYKCIPHDTHLPVFLVPYEIDIQFSKFQKNKYVLFKFENWEYKHPCGILTDTLGNVDNLDVFYEYQLYCKGVNISLTQFTKKTRELMQKKTEEDYINEILHDANFNIEDARNKHNIFTIDPTDSTDFDDAISIEHVKESNQYKISIYISNVHVWLETLDLWKHVTSAVSTIYLPNRKKPMLPVILSDNLCSLKQGNTRFAFCMEIIYDIDATLLLKSIQCKNVAIIVKKNYKYEEDDLIKTPDYSLLLSITKKLDNSVMDSHDLVAYWMVKMNNECGNYMANKNIGIFRLTNYTKPFHDEISHLENNTQRIIKSWSNSSCKYVVHDGRTLQHEIMNTINYIHITSPIRRLIDILNQIWISKSFGITATTTSSCEIFLNDWINKLDYVNSAMRSIRKIQCDSQLLNVCFNNEIVMNSIHDGVVFDKTMKKNGYIEYMVYLNDLKMLGRIKTSKNYDNYTNHSFHIFLFHDECNMKKKIRLQFHETS